ncbi:MAG TPA: alpha/beta fold hydrolase, partial [Mycobacterium sp.]|nr:alpha/beta fold hydrolase [Mycobacterium sp.]
GTEEFTNLGQPPALPGVEFEIHPGPPAISSGRASVTPLRNSARYFALTLRSAPLRWFRKARLRQSWSGGARQSYHQSQELVRPQPRGIAGSVGPMTGVGFDDMAHDIAAVIDAVADGPAVVLGHAFGNFVARATAVHHRELVAAVILAAASGKTVAPEINSAPMRAGDLSLPENERLAALRLAFFAPGHDASIWLDGWYPDTLAMQVDCVHDAVQHADVARYWGAGSAPVFEIIAALDPFHQRNEWPDLRARYGERITST